MPKRQGRYLALFLCLFSMLPAVDNQVDMQHWWKLVTSADVQVASLSANC